MFSQLPEEEYRFFFSDSPVAMLIIDNGFIIQDANAAFVRTSGYAAAFLTGLSLSNLLEAKGETGADENIRSAVAEKTLPRKALLALHSGTLPAIFHIASMPLRNDAGNIYAYMLSFTPDGIEEEHSPGRNGLQQLYTTLMQLPVGIAVFKDYNYIIDLVNPVLCELFGQKPEEVTGQPLFSLPGMQDKERFKGNLDQVRANGSSYRDYARPVTFYRQGRQEDGYIDFVYEPLRENDGTVYGVLGMIIDVTDRVLAKNRIWKAEESVRLAVDAVGLGTFDVDLKTGELITSPLFAKIWGFDQPVDRGQYINAIHPDDRPIRTGAHKEAMKNGRLFYEARIVKGAGIAWVRVEGKVFYDDNHQPERILGTVLDITEQRHSREQEQKLITLVDNSVDLMSILDMDGTNSYLNAAGMQLLGFDHEEQVKNTPISSLHDPADFEKVEKEVLPSVMSRGKWSGVMTVRNLKSGEKFPVLNNCIRIDDPVSGKPLAVGAVMRDLRPELAAKKSVEDSEQLLRNITSAAPTALWMSDVQGSLTYVNQTWINWTGVPYEKNIGVGWIRAIYPPDRPKVMAIFRNNSGAHKSYEIEFRLQHADGTLHWCMANGQPQYTGTGRFSGYIGACVDITELKHLQQQKDDFIGIASHELKTPVTSIKAYIQVLERLMVHKGDQQVSSMLNRVDLQMGRLTNLINDLLDVTKINSGKIQFNNAPFDFNPMLLELIEDVQRTIATHTIITDLGPDALIFGDQERIGQVVTNFITNAVKYSPQARAITIRTRTEAARLTLSVEDTGIGIAADKLHRVFEQFYRVSGHVQHTFPGMGLGLFISAEIIKRQNGKIWAESIPEKGSIFHFSLPVAHR